MMRNMLVTAITINALGNVAAADNDPAKKAPETHTPYRVGVNHAPQAVLAGRTARPMRYTPEDGGFVITNGDERFNRPLYIGRGGARFDAGDRPEFAFYLPGKGGALRLGIAAGDQAKWLLDADTVNARFAEGRMTYTVRDALLGDGEWTIDAVPADDRIAALVRVEQTGGSNAELVWAYGGATGAVDFRGDIGYMDIVRHYGLQDRQCANNRFATDGNGFVLRAGQVRVSGVVSSADGMKTAAAAQWADPEALLSSQGDDQPVILGRASVSADTPFFIALIRGEDKTLEAGSLAERFAASVAAKRAIANQVAVDTPNPYINAAVPALNTAADALFDGNWYMHGNVAWRRPMAGWRCGYTGDALGWPERSRRHIDSALRKQITRPVNPDATPTRQSEGWIQESHYDMNLVLFDALMRHLLWTGDREYARQVWPNIKRHLAWEKRCFDRGGLYEAWPCIWASDALQYAGGGVAHASAYNYYQNKMAARIARWIGEDPAPYVAEAKRIHAAMQELLWLQEQGAYAEYRDTWGLKRAHPSGAVWTTYHTLDSEVPTPLQAWQMLRDVQTRMPQIPVHGAGVPEGDWTLMPLSDWMPYSWSINNVAAEETYHTALAAWQAGRSEQAWNILMGTVLENMYRGICPGNVGMTLSFCAYRGECIRDFGDTIGIMCRTLVEGLFGVVPDAIAGVVTIKPGWPADWERASFKHPSIGYRFERADRTDRYVVEPAFPQPMTVSLVVPARGTGVTATVNGKPASVENVDDSVGAPRVRVQVEPAERLEIVLNWTGEAPAGVEAPPIVCVGDTLKVSIGRAELRDIADPQKALAESKPGKHGFTAAAVAAPGHKTVFARVRQGDWSWWMPVAFELRPALEIVTGYDGRETPRYDAEQLRFRIRNNTEHAINGPVAVTVGDWQGELDIELPAGGESDKLVVSPQNLLPGRHEVGIEAGGRKGSGTVVNWGATVDPAACVTVDLTPAFNDCVSKIFAPGKYTAPELPPVSLGIPDSGVGHWCRKDTHRHVNIDPAGLLDRARKQGDKLTLPAGVPFHVATAAGTPNIAFVSQWETFPEAITVPLSGRARHAYLLMAGSTHHMQSRFDNGEIMVVYADGSEERLVLRNPENWWPIERDYFIDDYAFRVIAARPPRVRLDSGEAYFGTTAYTRSGSVDSHQISGGAATVLDLPLDPTRELKALKLRATANEVVIGLMAVTLAE